MPENNIFFTPGQIRAIINTLLPLPAKDCYDVLKMIDIAVEQQTKKDEPDK